MYVSRISSFFVCAFFIFDIFGENIAVQVYHKQPGAIYTFKFKIPLTFLEK